MKKLDNVKAHIREHKELYIGVAIGATAVIVLRRPDVVQKAITFGDNSPIIQVAQPIRRGHPGLIVRIKETGEIVASKRRAAELLGVHFSKVNDLVDVLGEAK